MAGSSEAGRKWLSYGCFGCLGILGVLILFAGGVTGFALLKARSEQVEDRVLTQKVPVTPGTPEAAGSPPKAAATGPPRTGDSAPSGTSGRVILDLSHAQFGIRSALRGEPLRVEATYDANSYELQESFETQDGRGWTYRVSFGRTGSSMVTDLKELMGGTRPKVHIFLPVDVPLSLDFQLSQGGSQVKLGGLWLTSASFNLDMGGVELSIDEPLPAPMERLSIRGSMGGFSISSLGNASPRHLNIDCSMAGMELDLRGQWLQDSQISINSRMAGVALRLPRDVVIEGLDTDRFDVRAEPEVKPPTLTFSVSSRMGEVEIVD